MSRISGAALRIGLVGASGWLGRSIGPALLRERIVEPMNLTCCNRSGRSQDYADWPNVCWVTKFDESGPDADVVILSVRPQDFRQSTFPCEGKLVISLMAGVTLDELHHCTDAQRVVRAMPNAAVEIGRSYSPWVASPSVTTEDRRIVRAVLNAVGTSDEVDSETALNILTGLSGAGPAYAALLANALWEAAVDAGLKPDIAGRAVEATVCDAAMLLLGQGAAAGEIVDDFIRYDGTTAAAMRAAQSAGFDAAVRTALTAAIQKAREIEDAASRDEAP